MRYSLLLLTAVVASLCSFGAAVADSPADKEKEMPAAGADPGEALPFGAIARCGNARWRFGSAVRSLAFSKDGEFVFVGGGDGHVYIFEVPSGRLQRKLEGHKHSVGAIAVSRDNKLLAAAAGGKSFLIWDLGKEQVVGKFEAGFHGADSLTFSPDDKLLAWIGSAEGKLSTVIRIHNVATGKMVHELKGDTGLYTIEFSPDSRTLVAGGHIRGVEVWEVASGKMRQTFMPRDGQVTSAAFSGDGRAVVAATSGGVFAWDLASEKPLRQFSLERHWAERIAVSADGKVLAVPRLDNKIRLWDWQTGKELRDIACEPGFRPGRVFFAPSGKVLAGLGASSNQIGLWDVATGKPLHRPSGHTREVTGLAWSPTQDLFASVSWDSTIRFWEPATGKELRHICLEPNRNLTALAFLPDGKQVLVGDSSVIGGDGNFLKLFDVDRGKEIRTVATKLGGIRALAVSGDGKHVAFADTKSISILDLASGKELRRLPEKGDLLAMSLAFLPDGKSLICGTINKKVILWDLNTGADRLLGEHRGSVRSIAVHPNGLWVASGGADGTARIWEVAGGKEALRVGEKTKHCFAVALAPQGNVLAASTEDALIRFWDAKSGKELAAFPGHHGYAMSLAFSRDGKKLVSAGRDTTLVIWDVDRLLDPTLVAGDKLSPQQLEGLWQALAEADAVKAFRAIRAFASAPNAMPFLKERLTPVVVPDKVKELLKDLESEDFVARERASSALEKMGPGVVPALRRVLDQKPAPEVKVRLERLLEKIKLPAGADPALREGRIVEILEHNGGAEARALLESLARAEPESRLSREARAALERLDRGKKQRDGN